MKYWPISEAYLRRAIFCLKVWSVDLYGGESDGAVAVDEAFAGSMVRMTNYGNNLYSFSTKLFQGYILP